MPVRAAKCLGRALLRRLTGYHRKSRVETKVNCVELMGQSLMLQGLHRQVAQTQIRIAVLNRYTTLAMPVTVAAGQARLRKGKARTSPNSAT